MSGLDPIIHAPVRLQIMASLAILSPLSPGLDFTTLKQMTGATDGNLGAHIATLETAGYLAVTKAFVNRRPRTSAQLTPAGREAFAAHVAALRRIIDGNGDAPGEPV